MIKSIPELLLLRTEFENITAEYNMITQNDIEKAKHSCYHLYERYQATMAGQLGHDLAELQDDFEEICAEFGLNIEDTWEECENNHSASYGL